VRGVIAGLVAIALVAGIAGFFIGRPSATPPTPNVAAQQQAGLKRAYERCRSEDTGGTLQLADNGGTIVVDTGSEYGSTAGVDCVFEALGTPESIKAQVGRTTALMGVQNADHQGIRYSWS